MIPKSPSTTLHPSEPANPPGFWRRAHVDFPLLLGLLLISAYGTAIIYSATDQSLAMMERQVLRLLMAFGLLVGIAQVHPRHIYRWSPWLYTLGVLMLLAVLLIGDIGKGAQRWLDFGFIRFQPSELLKLAVPMMLAWLVADKAMPPNWRYLSTMLMLTVVPVLLIAKQPDLGTALLVASAGAFVIFLSGLRWRVIIGAGLAVLGCLPLLWHHMHEYQRQRVLTFLDPETDPLGAGYHIIQSKIAIGSGGMFGKGWLQGTQSHLEFLPERSTDFIFAVLSEEFGLLGIILLMLLYLFVTLRGLYIATQAQDTFGRLLSGAVTLIFFVYLFVNMGMVTGMLPVVGVPLPLVSYGGTSLVTIMIGFGILMSIHTHRKFLSH